MDQKEQFYKNKFKTEKKITISTFFCNIILSFGKLLGGIFGNSSALISDSINSIGDIMTSIITFIGTKIGSKEADKTHEYGHQRIQSISIIIFEMIVVFSGVIIIYTSVLSLIEKITNHLNGTLDPKSGIPTLIALIIAVCVIFIKFTLFIVCSIYYKKTKSNLLKAARYDHLFDSIGTTLSLIGVCFAMFLGVFWIDDVMSIVIACFIIFVAIKMMLENINAVVDKSWGEENESKIRKYIIDNFKQVISIDMISTRIFAERVYVDLEVKLDGNMSIKDGHSIIEKIELGIENTFFEIIHVHIHINPSK